MKRGRCALLCAWLAACTDLGVIGQRAPASAGAAGVPGPTVAGTASSPQCPFGVCNVPPLCREPEPFCFLCESDADCVRDPAEPRCSLLTSTCVACVSAADCGRDAPYCDGGECVLCEEDEHCPDDFKCNDGRCERD